MFAMKHVRKVQAVCAMFSQSRRRTHSAPGAIHAGSKRTQAVVPQPLVLIADDSADDRWIITRSFVRAGFRVAEVTSGEDVVAAFNQHQPMVVVLDLLMPLTGGLSACQALREQPGGAHVPVVLISGLGDPGTRHRALAVGASAFLPKPRVGEGYVALVQRVCELIQQRGLPAGDEALCATDAGRDVR